VIWACPIVEAYNSGLCKYDEISFSFFATHGWPDARHFFEAFCRTGLYRKIRFRDAIVVNMSQRRCNTDLSSFSTVSDEERISFS